MLVARSHKEVFVGFLHFVRRKEGKKEEGCAWPGAMRRKEIREGRKEGRRACFDEFEIRTRTERESHTHHRSLVPSAHRPGYEGKDDSFSHLEDFSLVHRLVGETGM